MPSSGGQGARIPAAIPASQSWSLPASFGFHALLILAFFAFPDSRMPILPPPETTPVEIWTPEQWEELAAAGTPQKPDDAAPSLPTVAEPITPPSTKPPQAPPPETPPKISGMTRAATLLSANVLSNPRSRAMRLALPTFEEETRMEQLCGIEAMAQITASMKPFEPDRVVAYAMADVKRVKDTLTAEGGAFRSDRKWYRLKFECRVSRDRERVEDFAFSVGDAIPKTQWEAHGLSPIF